MEITRSLLSTQRILVATDLGEPADEALRVASALCRKMESELLVCHVLPRAVQIDPMMPHLHERLIAQMPAIREAALRSIEDRMVQVADRKASEFKVLLEEGPPHAAILEAAERVGADLVVVGPHAAGGLSRILLGNVAERVVRHAHTSVLVARASPRTGKVVAAMDFSEEASAALRLLAGPWAKRLAGGLSVVHVLDMMPLQMMSPFPYLPAGIYPSDAQLKRMYAVAAERMAQVMKDCGVEGHAVVLEGFPGEAIVRHASDVDAELVVVGTTGRTGIRRFAFGSVAERVVRTAPCSVLVARPSSHPREAL